MKYQQLTAVAITALSSASMVSAAPSPFMPRDTVCPAGYSPSLYYVTVTVTPTPTPTPAVQPVETTSTLAVSTNLPETESLPICGGSTSVQAVPTQSEGQTQVTTSAVQSSAAPATTSTADVAPVAQQTTSAVESTAPVAQVKTSSTSTTTTVAPAPETTSVVSTSSTSEAAPPPVTTSTSEVAPASATTSSTSEAASPATTSSASSATTSSAATAATSSSSSSSSSTALSGSYSGEATYYTSDGVTDGTCSFSGYTLPSGIFGTALSDSNWDTAAHCGACVEVTYSGTSIKAMIVDECPGCGENHLDLFPGAFSELAELSVGVLDVTWEYVECGISTPLSLKAKDGSSQYWFSMQVVNSNLPVKSLEVSTDGGETWQTTTRTYYNFFEKDDGFGTETVDVRITSETGSTLVVESVSCSSSASTTASSNF